MLAGDIPIVAGNVLQVWRDGVNVANRVLVTGPVIPQQPLLETKTITELFFFKETKMPGTSVANTDVTVSGAGGVTFKFSDGDQREFASWEAAGQSVADFDTNGEFNKVVIIAKAISRSPDGANKTNMVGASVSCNREAAVPVVVTYPE